MKYDVSRIFLLIFGGSPNFFLRKCNTFVTTALYRLNNYNIRKLAQPRALISSLS